MRIYACVDPGVGECRDGRRTVCEQKRVGRVGEALEIAYVVENGLYA